MNYPTNLTDKQWQVIKNIVETKERKRKYPLRSHHIDTLSSIPVVVILAANILRPDAASNFTNHDIPNNDTNDA